jgi:hypothetical protein
MKTQPSVTVKRTPAKSGSREVWHIFDKGESRTIITSGTSTVALDEAMLRYAPALKRLADR